MGKPWYRIVNDPPWRAVLPDHVLLESHRGGSGDFKTEDEVSKDLLYVLHTIYLAGRASMAEDINKLLKEGG